MEILVVMLIAVIIYLLFLIYKIMKIAGIEINRLKNDNKYYSKYNEELFQENLKLKRGIENEWYAI